MPFDTKQSKSCNQCNSFARCHSSQWRKKKVGKTQMIRAKCAVGASSLARERDKTGSRNEMRNISSETLNKILLCGVAKYFHGVLLPETTPCIYKFKFSYDDIEECWSRFENDSWIILNNSHRTQLTTTIFSNLKRIFLNCKFRIFPLSLSYPWPRLYYVSLQLN